MTSAQTLISRPLRVWQNETAIQHRSAAFTNPYGQQAIQAILREPLANAHEIVYRDFVSDGMRPFPIDGKVIGCRHAVDGLKPEWTEWASRQDLSASL